MDGDGSGGDGGGAAGGGGAGICLKVTFCPPIRRPLVRSAPGFAATWNHKSAAPKPFPAVVLIQSEIDEAIVHAQKSSVETVTFTSPPLAPIVMAAGATAKTHSAGC